MGNLKILNSKETKEIMKSLKLQYGFEDKLDYAFLRDTKDRIHIVSKDIAGIDLRRLRINSIGMYFCTIEKDGIRLTIDGSQIIGPGSDKNIIDIDDAQLKQWISGVDLDMKTALSGYVLIRHGNDFIGSGKASDRKIFNYVPKARRISS